MKVKLFKIRLSNDHLDQDQDELNAFLETISVKKTNCQFINDQPNCWSILVFYVQKTVKPENITNATETPLTEEEQKAFDSLKLWRQIKANELNLPAYMICGNATLIRLVKDKPDTLEKLALFRGFGTKKVAQFGDEIIALFNSI